MRKLLIGLGILIVVLVVLVIVVPMLIPAQVYRDRLVAATEAATGRQLHIGGPVSVTVFPNVAIEANTVALDNAPGGQAKEMATLSKLQVGVKLFPLLSGNVQVTRFVLTDPVIHLEVAKDGRPNWEFSPAQKTVAPAAAPEAAKQTESLKQLQLGEVKLINGTVDYFDARSNAHYALNQIGVTVSLPSLDEKSAIDGAVTWNGKPVTLSATIDRPRVLLGTGTSPLRLSVKSEPVNLSFDGSMTGGTSGKLEGNLSVESSSMRSAAAWAGSPPPIGGNGLGSFSLKGKLVSAGPNLSFSDIALNLDALKATGNLAVDGSGPVPVFKGALNVGMLDINPYLARPGKAPSTAPAAPGPQAAVPPNPPAAPGRWSDAPIDVTPLRGVDADLTLAADGVRYEKIEIGKSALALQLKGGRLILTFNELQVYGGNGKGQVVLDGSGAVPAIGLNFGLNGVQAEPLLAAAIDLDRVTGTGQLNIDLKAQGHSQRELVGALSGKGAFSFANGAIKGIDLAAMAKNVTQAFAQAVTGGAQQTQFGDFGGTFTAANGILRTDDLALKSPVVQMSGTGTVDLPQRTLDFRIVPNVAVGSQDVAVPILVKGPLDKPTYQPDVQGLLTKNAGKLIQGLTGKAGSNTGSNPAGMLKGLFGK